VAESSKATTATTVEGTSTYKIDTAFTSTSDEALFGLGQRQDNNMNMKGKSTRLLNANTNINIPMMVSNKGYGICANGSCQCAGTNSNCGPTCSACGRDHYCGGNACDCSGNGLLVPDSRDS
jgi:alpha-glucosidase (family GH31 glycosyl hydrolase)